MIGEILGAIACLVVLYILVCVAACLIGIPLGILRALCDRN